jgi:hemerythrin-like domain-containing protein
MQMSVQSFTNELQHAFDRQMSLCDLLEAIADSLPERLDRQQCLHVARLIAPLIKQAHLAEEQLLFPQVAARHAEGADVIETLRLEHFEDECFAEEVQYELLQMGKGQPVLAPEATGYMLRGFFEGVRRHIRREQELLSCIQMQPTN